MVKLAKLKTRCFFDVSIAEESVGRIVFELFNDVCARTCENFKALCTGEKGLGKLTGKPLHYKDVPFHRIVKNFIIQSGDFSQGNGKGGESIYGGTFEDESFHYKHDKPFLLSMANRGKNTNGSQFFITLAPSPHLDGVHVVFGHVISGQEVVKSIANQAVDKHSKPLVSIRISNCGELIPQIKPKESDGKKKRSKKSHKSDSEESDSSSSDSEDDSDDSGSSDSDESSEDEKGKHKKAKKGDKDEEKADGGDEKEPEEDDLVAKFFAPKHNVKINADEIPEVPSNRFLSRGFKPKENENGDNDNEEPKSRQRHDDRQYSRRFNYSKSGRKIKGRGFIRFRTPSPNEDERRHRRRRSETPPHWRSEQSKLKTFKEYLSDAKNGGKKPEEGEDGEKPDRSQENRRERRRRNDDDEFMYRPRYGRDRRNDRSERSPSRERKRRSYSRSPVRSKNGLKSTVVAAVAEEPKTEEHKASKSPEKKEDYSRQEKENRHKRQRSSSSSSSDGDERKRRDFRHRPRESKHRHRRSHEREIRRRSVEVEP